MSDERSQKTMPPSPALPTRFVFVDKPSEFHHPGALLVRVPRGIRSKEKLMAVIADRLRFPGYFGWNWDAFEECLNDLSGLPQRSILLVHEDLPFGDRSSLRATYVDILRKAAAANRAEGNR